MIKKRYLLFLVFFVIVSFVYAEGLTSYSVAGGSGSAIFLASSLTQNNFIYVDSQIDIELNNSEWVKVIIILKDNSGVVFVGSKEDRKNILKQKNNWFKPKIEEILANLSSEDFKLTSQTSIGFNGEISNQGFEKLKNNSLIERIDLDHESSATEGSTITSGNEDGRYTGFWEKITISPVLIFLGIIGVIIFVVFVLLLIKYKINK